MKAFLPYLLFLAVAGGFALSCNSKSGKSVSLDPAEFRSFKETSSSGADTNSKLSDGIYCAQIIYNYGDKHLAMQMDLPSDQYGGRWDTIQVRLRDNYITEFIFNEESTFPIPVQPTDKYWPDGTRYMAKGAKQGSVDPFSGIAVTAFPSADGQYIISYVVTLFGSANKCRTSKRHTPTLAENMAANDSMIAVSLRYRQKQEAEQQQAAAQYRQRDKQEADAYKQDMEYRKNFSDGMIKENNELQKRQSDSPY
ncbi:hypothetical protein [Spirosoma arcticum]